MFREEFDTLLQGCFLGRLSRAGIKLEGHPWFLTHRDDVFYSFILNLLQFSLVHTLMLNWAIFDQCQGFHYDLGRGGDACRVHHTGYKGRQP